MKKEDLILLSVYPGYHPTACKRTIKNNDRMITIFYDDVILEANSSKPNQHGDRLVDKRYRKFIDAMPVPNFLLFQMAGKYHGDQIYKQLIQTTTDNKITIVVKGKIAVYRFKDKRCSTYTKRPPFTKEKSPYSLYLRDTIIRWLRNHSGQYVKDRLKRKYNLNVSLAEIYKIKKQNKQPNKSN